MFHEIALALALGTNPSADLSVLGSEMAIDLGRMVQKTVIRQRNILPLRQRVVVRQNVVAAAVVVQPFVAVQTVRVRAAIISPFVSTVAVSPLIAEYHAPYQADNLRQTIREELRADRESQALRDDVAALRLEVRQLRQALTAPGGAKITPIP